MLRGGSCILRSSAEEGSTHGLYVRIDLIQIRNVDKTSRPGLTFPSICCRVGAIGFPLAACLFTGRAVTELRVGRVRIHQASIIADRTNRHWSPPLRVA